MESSIDSSWCTVKEFCRITSWHLSDRRLRQKIEENCFEYPVKKLCYSSRRFIYIIQLSDPNQIKALRRLRERCLVRKKVNEHARKALGLTVIHSSTVSIKKRRTVRVKIRGYDYVFIRSSKFLKSLYSYIRNTGKNILIKKDYIKDISIEKEKFGSVFICVSQDVYDELSKIAEKVSCSIGDALHIMILEFLKTRQGKKVAFLTAKL